MKQQLEAYLGSTDLGTALGQGGEVACRPQEYLEDQACQEEAEQEILEGQRQELLVEELRESLVALELQAW